MNENRRRLENYPLFRRLSNVWTKCWPWRSRSYCANYILFQYPLQRTNAFGRSNHFKTEWTVSPKTGFILLISEQFLHANECVIVCVYISAYVWSVIKRFFFRYWNRSHSQMVNENEAKQNLSAPISWRQTDTKLPSQSFLSGFTRIEFELVRCRWEKCQQFRGWIMSLSDWW